MVCEKGRLQFVGLYDILTEKDTPATGVEDSDCVHYSNSRLHPVHRVGFFCRLNHQPCESMNACEICLRAEDGRWWIPAGYGCLKPAAVRRMGVVRTQRGQYGSASGFHTGGGRWWCETAGG